MLARFALVAAVVASAAAPSAAPAAAPVAPSAAPATGPVVVTGGPIQNGRMTAIGHPPDFQVGCSTTVFTAQLIIEVATGSATGVSVGECGVQTTSLPAGSCRSNLPSRPGFSCAHTAADGTRRYASTNSSESIRSFSFSEFRGNVWFQVDGVGAGIG